MYLLDTNIFLEILLKREKSKDAKHIFISNPPTALFITDFSLHSIGVFLFQRSKHDVYERFVNDTVIRTEIGVVGLDPEDIPLMAGVSKRFNLDFDDAYQYAVAVKYGLDIMSFDADFDRTEIGRKVPDSRQ